MFEWMNVLWPRRGAPAFRPREAPAETPKPQGRPMAGKYALLHKYLDARYANMVVLTFAEIEDLLGFALPDQARVQGAWWTDAERSVAGPNYSDAWILASRTAAPNLLAQTVAFERAQ